MHIQPITPNIGAEISGIDLDDKAQVSDHATALRQALAQHQVIFFREQQLTPDSQVHLARLFGTVEPVSSTFPSHPQEPHVELLISQGQRTGTDIWHAHQDLSEPGDVRVLAKLMEAPADVDAPLDTGRAEWLAFRWLDRNPVAASEPFPDPGHRPFP